jgi:hypothetical protein
VDWLKVEKSTPLKPEIRQIARACGCSRGEAFAGWFRLWAVFDDLVDANGWLNNYSQSDADEDAGLDGIAKALEDVGWLVWGPTGVSITNWSRHNGTSAKQRALTARRVAAYRRRNAHSVTAPLHSA